MLVSGEGRWVGGEWGQLRIYTHKELHIGQADQASGVFLALEYLNITSYPSTQAPKYKATWTYNPVYMCLWNILKRDSALGP